MARIAHGVGTTIIATTPHNFPRSTLSIGEEARHRVALLQRAVNEGGHRDIAQDGTRGPYHTQSEHASCGGRRGINQRHALRAD